VKQFKREIASEQTREKLMADVLQTVTVPLARHRYVIDGRTDTSLIFVRTYRPWWVWIITIGLFPIGILAYLGLGERAYVTMTFEQLDGHALLRVSGEGTKEVSAAFETMSV
jgi:hypothetical protein